MSCIDGRDDFFIKSLLRLQVILFLYVLQPFLLFIIVVVSVQQRVMSDKRSNKTWWSFRSRGGELDVDKKTNMLIWDIEVFKKLDILISVPVRLLLFKAAYGSSHWQLVVRKKKAGNIRQIDHQFFWSFPALFFLPYKSPFLKEDDDWL